jgi:hypothetical protein
MCLGLPLPALGAAPGGGLTTNSTNTFIGRLPELMLNDLLIIPAEPRIVSHATRVS